MGNNGVATHNSPALERGLGSGLQGTFFVQFRQALAIVRVFPGLRFFVLALPPGLLTRRLILMLVFVTHSHLPSVRIGHTFSIEQRTHF